MKIIAFITTISVTLLASTVFAQQVLYVKSDAQGIGNGQNWANALPNLQNALQAATYGTEVRVAAGTYYPTNDLNRDSSFILLNGVKLRGGFSGDDANPVLQDPSLYPTILSGDIGIPGNKSDNSYSILIARGSLDENSLLEGFVIENGSANSTNPSDHLFSAKKSGAGIFINTNALLNNLRIERCIFRDNLALGHGAHIFIQQIATQSNLRIEHCQFIEGAGISSLYFYGNTPDSIYVNDCIFQKNTSPTPPYSANVASFSRFDKANKIVVTQCLFSENNIGGQGTAGRVILGLEADTVEVNECVFRDNIHSSGFVLSVTALLSSKIQHNVFLRNQTAIGQGYNDAEVLGLNSGSCDLNQVVSDCLFEQNVESRLCWPTYSALFSKCTFRQNILKEGLFIDQSTTTNCKKVEIDNCLFENNTFRSLTDFMTLEGSVYPVDDKDWIFNQSFFHGNTGLMFDSRRHNVTSHISNVTWNFCTFSDNLLPQGHSGDTLPYLFYLRNIDFATFNSCVFDQPIKDTTCLFFDSLCQIQLKNSLFYADSCKQTCKFSNALSCAGNFYLNNGGFFADKNSGDFRLADCSPGINKGDFNLSTVLNLNLDFSNGNRIEHGLPDIGAFEKKCNLKAEIGQYSCQTPASGSVVFYGNACGPFSSTWWDGANSGVRTDSLPAGVYEFTVTDALGITFFDAISIPSFDPISIDTLLQNPSNLTTSDGSIEITAIHHGFSPFEFHWSTEDTTTLIDNLAAGFYAVTITDALGCEMIFRFELDAASQVQESNPEAPRRFWIVPNIVSKGQSVQIFGDNFLSAYRITSVLGSQFFRPTGLSKQLDLPNFNTSGVYWITAQDAETGNWSKPMPVIVF